ncbi:MAG TPA: membrane bound O-acyl transferase family-domain-containing protein [Thermoanaerobaculia bacterium]|nr:membrane bound O-acyl transferase family-domain-containing protein [Thermoanaerobaculia bacterium]
MKTMLVLIGVTFVVVKLAVLARSRVQLAPSHAIAFFFWPGMRPSTFAQRRATNGVRERMLRGIRNLAIGGVMLVGARLIAPYSIIAAIVIALPALSLMLHFGVLTIATAAWRAAGFDAEDLFRKPWRAQSLGEFWSRRWNIGFSDMMSVLVNRPIAARFGRNAGVMAAFLASGLLHEIAISIPARGGYGLPTLYFALHGALVAAGVRGRITMLVALLLPLPLCFHAPFLRAVIIPMLQ